VGDDVVLDLLEDILPEVRIAGDVNVGKKLRKVSQGYLAVDAAGFLEKVVDEVK
jgi:hypothetical protein